MMCEIVLNRNLRPRMCQCGHTVICLKCQGQHLSCTQCAEPEPLQELTDVHYKIIDSLEVSCRHGCG